MAEPNAWRIEITVPLGLTDELRDRLFTAVADVVHEWEPADREGWDAFVSGHPVFDEFVGEVRPPVRDVCCPHCTTKTGSCVRCGVRDAEDGEQLCGRCDVALEAEVAAGRAARAVRGEQA